MKHDIVQPKAEVLTFIIILLPPPSINVGGSDKASDNITGINIELGNRVTFSPNQTECVSLFSHDCLSLLDSPFLKSV